jgi:hypothetical protein
MNIKNTEKSLPAAIKNYLVENKGKCRLIYKGDAEYIVESISDTTAPFRDPEVVRVDTLYWHKLKDGQVYAFWYDREGSPTMISQSNA